jgi:hypothetical protein
MLEQLTFNIDHNAIREDRLEGREYFVVPMVMLTEGVHEGSGGPLYYPSKELETSVPTWNHKPIVVYHPQINGQPVSACNPVIINSHKVGLILNTQWENKLRAEAWLEKERLRLIDRRVLDHINKRQMMEVSTGVFTENEQTTGRFKGKTYTAIARNYKADHLALLPDKKGACSIEDGAGLLQLNSAPEYKVHGELNKQLHAKLGSDNGPWVLDVFDDFVVYQKDDKVYRLGYFTHNNQVGLSKSFPEEVVKSYLPVNEEKNMARKDDVDKLIANKRWEESDRDFLTKLDDKAFEKLVKNEDAAAQALKDKDELEKRAKEATDKYAKLTANMTPEEIAQLDKKGVEDATKKGAEGLNPTTNDKKPVTVDDYINNAPPEMKGMLRHGINAYSQQKAHLIKSITANERNRFTEQQLNAKEIDELEALAALAVPAAPTGQPAPIANYFGAAVPAPTTNAQPGITIDEPLLVPTMDFSKK